MSWPSLLPRRIELDRGHLAKCFFDDIEFVEKLSCPISRPLTVTIRVAH